MAMTAETQREMLLAALAPFYVSEKVFPSVKTDYGCVVCADPVIDDTVTKLTPDVQDVSVSYATTTRGVWAHSSCLTSTGIAPSDNWKKRQAAHAKIRKLEIERQAVEKDRLTRTTTAPDATALRAEIRAEITAEFETRMQQAVTVLTAVISERDMLKAERDQLLHEIGEMAQTGVEMRQHIDFLESSMEDAANAAA